MTGQECFPVAMDRGGAVLLLQPGKEAVRKACPFPRRHSRAVTLVFKPVRRIMANAVQRLFA